MATTTAHTEQPGHKAPFPPFNGETFASQLFWLVLCFVFLFVMMWKVALPRIGAIVDTRQKKIDDDLGAAEALKKQSDDAIAAYEKALADARNRAQAIANETRDKQAAAAEAQRKSLEDQLNTRLAGAEKTIAATKQAAMGNVRVIAADTAKAIVERLIGSAPDDQAVSAAVADALKR
ncbi:MAG: F0F1 ATP synthase subunit B' [Pseudolabrys sp.]|nr:F0F1 ATP synthase subunit B' [Pseudolabrys sp.]